MKHLLFLTVISFLCCCGVVSPSNDIACGDENPDDMRKDLELIRDISYGSIPILNSEKGIELMVSNGCKRAENGFSPYTINNTISPFGLTGHRKERLAEVDAEADRILKLLNLN